MLTSLTLKKVASYKEEDQELGPLKPLNFIYGENGCGKSTIAQFLDCEFNDRDTEHDFSSCSVCKNWDDTDQRRICVYDADFVKRTIDSTTIEGVFVMGEDAPELEKELKDKEQKIDDNKKKISKINDSIVQINENLTAEEKSFSDYCWGIGKPHKELFKDAYTGHMKPQLNFMKKCIQYVDKKDTPKSLDELKEAAKLYFSDEGRPEDIKPLPVFAWNSYDTLQGHSILDTAIKGKENTTVAELIAALGNNDWVDQGRDYFDGSKCPFCQQTAPETLKADLESYFDESYKQQKAELSQYSENYEIQMKALLDAIEKYSELENKFFKFENVELNQKVVASTIQNNTNELARKIKEPSIVISLKPITENLESIAKIISNANDKVNEYNEKLLTFNEGKQQLIEDVWIYLGSETSTRYKDFEKKKHGINTGITRLSTQIDDTERESKGLRERIVEIGDKLKSISKPAKDINNILTRFGFSNFSIKQVDDQARYAIVREDGSQASSTLSEGEKTFIAFLYFYQMIKGVDPDNGTLDDKIVIFDDPVSSLDSKVLYVVSTLIKKLAKERDSFKIHQLFLLTHNVYFFKEVTNQMDAELARSSYWIIRKTGRFSCIEHHLKNPVRTSYQMLWEEVNQAKEYDTLDVRNTLRRILENYFKMFGGKNIWDLAKPFEGDDQDICYSLLQWSNDGSHSVFDDLYMSQSVEGRNNYLRVFEEIFRKNGHGSHYDMMTKNEEAQAEEAA